MLRIVSALLVAIWGLSPMSEAIAQQTPPVPPKTVDTPPPIPVQIPLPPDPTTALPNRPLSADEAALIALRNQPNIAIARDALIAQQGVTQQVRSGLFPTLTLNGSYTLARNLAGNLVANPASSGSNATKTFVPASPTALGQGLDATATVHQLIFDFNHTRDLVRQSAALERAELQNLSAVQENVVYQVKQAYYLYVQDERLVATNQANLDNRNDQLKLTQARLNSGLGLPSDVVTAQTAVAQGVIGLNDAQNTATVQRISLCQQMGIDPRTPISTTDADEAPLATNDVNSLVATALQRRPEILQAQANIDANRYGLNAARTTSTPVISGNLQLLTHGDQFLPGNDALTVGAAIQFSPFDGGLTAGKVKQARAELASARQSLVLIQQQVIADVTQAYANLRSAEQRVNEATSEVQNAQEGVRIATGRFRAGLGQFLDIINAQAFLLTADTDLVNARGTVDIARAAVQRAIGTPLATGSRP